MRSSTTTTGILLLSLFIFAIGAAQARGHREPLLGVATGSRADTTCDKVTESYARFASWLGRKPDLMLDFAIYSNWAWFEKSATVEGNCSTSAGYPGIVYSLALIPSDGTATMAEGANGAYDDHFRNVAQILVATGHPDAIIRLGWEFNFKGWPWSASKDPQNYVKMWQRVVTDMRSVPGQNFKFDWCPGFTESADIPGQVHPEAEYPGDAYVDIVGLDFYNHWSHNPSANFDERWKTFVNAAYGLKWQRDFAVAHGKGLSFPEWGTTMEPNHRTLGDDPQFVQHMARWMKQNHFVYSDYYDWDSPPYNGVLSNGSQPLAGAAFRRAFGPR